MRGEHPLRTDHTIWLRNEVGELVQAAGNLVPVPLVFRIMTRIVRTKLPYELTILKEALAILAVFLDLC